MIYIYYDFGGTHSTSMAAAYHLKILDKPTKIPDKDEILAVPYFNKLKKKDAGKIIFHGEDEDGNPVYTIGKRSSKLVVPSLIHLSQILTDRYKANETIIFSNTSPVVPLAMTLGGFFSRGLGIDSIGVPLLVKGAQQCCKHVYELVEQTKEVASKTKEPTIVNIENHKFQA